MNTPALPSLVYLEDQVAPTLRHMVVRYYNVCGFTTPQHPYYDKTLPNGYTSCVFHFGDKIEVANVAYDGSSIPQHYVFGKYTKLIEVKHYFGKVDTFGIIFRPGAFRYLSSASQRQFTNALFEPTDVLGKSFRPYLSQMQDETFSNWPVTLTRLKQMLRQRKCIFETYLENQLRYRTISTDVVDTVLTYILDAPHKVSLKSLSKKFKTSEQYLNRRFNRDVGMSVVKYARIIRFNHLIRTFDLHPEEGLKRLVDDFDYTDTSHLVKDFKIFTGNRPTEFLHSNHRLARFLMHG